MLRLTLLSIIILNIGSEKSFAQDRISQLKGIWVVTSYYEGYATSYGKDSANSVIGKNLFVTDSTLSFLNYKLINPSYSLKKISSNELFPIFRRGARDVGIKTETIEVIRVQNPRLSYDWFEIVVDGGRIIYPDDGWFYVCTKVN